MKISKELQEKIYNLQEYESAYYNDRPLITDEAYDKYKDYILRKLPHNHPYLNKVGHTPVSNWPKEKHLIHMGSQNKVSNENDIKLWVKKVRYTLKIKDPEFIVQHKIDGFSLECVYEHEKLQRAVTRGNGVVGENITANAKMFRDMPNYIPVTKEVGVRGEGIINKADYIELQKETNNRYKNARNAAAGVSRRYDGNFSKYVRFLTYDVNAKVNKESDKVEVLKKLGFETVKTYVTQDIDSILRLYREYKDKYRKSLDYEIDGLVLKLNDIDLQEKMGVSHNRPEGQIALKFDSDQALTVIKDIILQIGRTGKVTPVAILEPVELMGSTVKKATLHNFAEVERLMVGVGAEVTIEKKGDIIPQVVEVLSPGKSIIKPDTCPSCGGVLSDDGVNLWCNHKNCREREVNRIRYWAEVVDLKGFSVKFIEKLWDMDKIRNVSDIYRLKPDDFTAIDGIGGKTVKSFFKKLEDTSEMYLDTFITALGIPSCSKSTAAVLVENFGSWEEIKILEPKQISVLPGFGDISAETICNGMNDIRDMADSLLQVIEIKNKKLGALTNKSFCVTGSLSEMSRKEFGEFVVDNGGIMKNSVVSGLSYLVTNNIDSGSSKNKKAKKLGVPIISEEEFFELAGKKKEKEEVKESENKEGDDPEIEYEDIFDL